MKIIIQCMYVCMYVKLINNTKIQYCYVLLQQICSQHMLNLILFHWECESLRLD